MDFETKDVLLQVELEHRLLLALVSPGWLKHTVELKRALLAWREKVAARDAVELSQSPEGGCQINTQALRGIL